VDLLEAVQEAYKHVTPNSVRLSFAIVSMCSVRMTERQWVWFVFRSYALRIPAAGRYRLPLLKISLTQCDHTNTFFWRCLPAEFFWTVGTTTLSGWVVPWRMPWQLLAQPFLFNGPRHPEVICSGLVYDLSGSMMTVMCCLSGSVGQNDHYQACCRFRWRWWGCPFCCMTILCRRKAFERETVLRSLRLDGHYWAC
jgi:hypothetical protein